MITRKLLKMIHLLSSPALWTRLNLTQSCDSEGMRDYLEPLFTGTAVLYRPGERKVLERKCKPTGFFLTSRK